ncbi:MAG: ABC transporter ATP-binding protein [Candidatus Omnitrophota bacterium]|nr:ABC transporter ATP-binding protein [Candidatus Omnitrophota bacterium]
MKYLKFYRYLLPFWKKEVLVLLLSGATMFLGLVNPYLTKLMIDKAYGNKDLKLFIILIAVGGAIFVFNGIINGITNYLSNYIRLRVNFNLNRKLFRKLEHLPYGFFQDSSTGEHLYKLNYDIEQVGRFISDTLPQAVSLLPKALFILAIVLYLNWRMALFALVLTPFVCLVPHYFTQQRKKSLKIWIEISQGIFKQLQEILTHIQLIKVFGKEDYEIRQYIKSLIEKIRFALKNTRLEISGSFANSLANRLILGLITFYGGYQLIKGQMSLGSLSAITIYLSQLSGLQGSFVQFFQQISLGFVSCERLDFILNSQPELIEDKSAKEIIFSKGCIEFRNVTFGYRQDRMILQNLTFCIEGGSCTALVGPSGCGKTTIINLILRLYKPDSGSMLIDGHNIWGIKSRPFFEQIGVVLQEPYLWNDTVENNIRYGKPGANFKEIAEASKIACIDDFINTLAQGYNTIIGENACKISEGQKQRIAIARAVIKKPRILILDEALSSVDAQIEARIIDNMMGSLRDATIIIVSHRFSAIKRTDLVFFLNSPDKIDMGTHEELLRNNLQYQNYLNHQLKEEKIGSDLFCY